MAAYSDQGVLPVSRERLWKFLELHLEDATIPRIHGDILSQRTLRTDGGVRVIERNIRFFGRSRRSIWRLTYDAPQLSRWEIVEGEGPMLPGSHLENTYTDSAEGTLVRSHGEIRVAAFPGFLQRRIVRTALDHIDAQDQRYLAEHPEIGA